ncbi:MAG TPA: C1 family peptidase [Candidatus Nitrosocosmicus sp.]|nr:C1 family peptidase [Candidatus Nitrosocosmicus sp.]
MSNSNDTPKIIPRQIKWYGYIPDLPDRRDKLYKVSRRKKTFPSKVDLSETIDSKFPIYDQSALGSCTANSIGAALAIVNIKQDIDNNRFDNSKIFTPSRLFIYYNERAMEGTIGEDSGAMIRDGIKSVNSLGVCKENTWTYDISKFTQKPSDPSYSEALFHQALKYERLDNTNINQLKNVLANDGLPFVFGFTVYESFESDDVAKTGNMPMPGPNERVLGGHAVLCVGYDDTTKRFKVRNSWGNDWGSGGYFFMPYDYMTNPNLVDDSWVISIVEESDQ